jgi:hypothetical protein
MDRFELKYQLKHFISASLFTIGLIAISIVLKSETTMKEEVSGVNEVCTVYDEYIVLAESKGKAKKDWNQKHIDQAIKVGVGSLKDMSALNKFIEYERLLSVVSDKGYIVADMTHSYPYLTKDAILTLRKIGASFYEASGDSSAFTVSSLTRTESTQKKLRKRNSNASKRESSHTFGVSFDISYIRYNGVREWNYERTKALEGVLATMQKNGEIYVLKERNQSCFHITIRNAKTS